MKRERTRRAEPARGRRGRGAHRAAIPVLAALVALLLLGGGAYLLFSEYALLGGRLVARGSASLTLAEGALPAAERLGALGALGTLDLRGRDDVTPAYVDAARAALPEGCAVLWTIRLSDGAFDSTSEALTLPHCTAEDAALLPCFTQLKRVDATGSTAYAALYAAAQALPETAFTYALPLGDTALTNADESVRAAGVDDVSALFEALAYFPALRSLDLRGGTADAADMRALAAAYPDIRLRYTVRIGEKEFDSDETAPDLTGVTFASAEEAVGFLSCFGALASADLTGTGLSGAQAQEVAAAFPEAAVRYPVALCGAEFPSDAAELDLRALAVDAQALQAGLAAFPALTAVYLPDGALSEADAQALEAAYPAVLFVRQVEVLGKTVSNGVEELDLSGTRLSGPEQAEEALALLPRLKKLILCDTGLTDEQMAALSAAHPQVRFVWTVQIGPHRVRTDATGFSTANPSKYTNPNASDEYNERVRTTKRLKEGDLAPLVYCTDLVALDLGHNYLTDADLAVIAQLQNLEILILADNKITDISALKSLKKLRYIELFMNEIPDVSPLASLTELVDVNICNIGLTDLSPLYGMTWLERLWYGMNPASRADEEALAAALPECQCNYTTRDETGEGWREHERYTWMRSFFK